ncbi:MAG TPA: PLDc N-terminal domain-containing protein [Bellilinea sp.]|nr:PLDc N-terminal domain-containing protein [Bellilinea sp.]
MKTIIALFSLEVLQGVELALVMAIAALVIFSLLKLRKSTLPDQTKAFWALTIVLIPIFGALAFLIVKPRNALAQ